MRRKDMLERMTQAALCSGEPILKQPLVELCGAHRVLVEQHMGVGEYSSETVNVNVRFGRVVISGRNLEICRMTLDQLVITGEITSVTLLKGIRT